MPPVGLQEAAGGTDLEGPDVGFIDEERGTEAMQAGPGRSQVHGAAAKAGLGEGARHVIAARQGSCCYFSVAVRSPGVSASGLWTGSRV